MTEQHCQCDTDYTYTQFIGNTPSHPVDGWARVLRELLNGALEDAWGNFHSKCQEVRGEEQEEGGGKGQGKRTALLHFLWLIDFRRE